MKTAVIKTEPFNHAGAKVLNHDIGAGNQFQHQATIGFLFQIGREALLVAVYRMKERAVAVNGEIRNIELPADIARLRTLDLDHSRSHIAQSESRGRAGEELAEIQDH